MRRRAPPARARHPRGLRSGRTPPVAPRDEQFVGPGGARLCSQTLRPPMTLTVIVTLMGLAHAPPQRAARSPDTSPPAPPRARSDGAAPTAPAPPGRTPILSAQGNPGARPPRDDPPSRRGIPLLGSEPDPTCRRSKIKSGTDEPAALVTLRPLPWRWVVSSASHAATPRAGVHTGHHRRRRHRRVGSSIRKVRLPPRASTPRRPRPAFGISPGLPCPMLPGGRSSNATVSPGLKWLSDARPHKRRSGLSPYTHSQASVTDGHADADGYGGRARRHPQVRTTAHAYTPTD